MSRLPHACVLLLVQLVAGCTRCGKATPPPAARTTIHRFLPRIAEAVVVVPANRGYWVIAISDPGRFHDAVRRLANNRLGASGEATRDELGNAVTYFSRSGEAGALLAFLV